MKRFYCTICKKVKRVRSNISLRNSVTNRPIVFEQDYANTPVTNRHGECNRHSDLQRRNSRGISATQFIDRVKGGR